MNAPAKTNKQRRDKLFGKSRPLVRAFDPVADMWVMWAAYDLGSFPALPKDLTVKEFGALVMAQVNSRSKCLVIEDDCKYFKSGRGPACFVAVDNFGWRIEPHADFFFWSTRRMTLRCTVAFLQMILTRADVGVCVVRALGPSANLFRHARKYVGCLARGLTEVGRIPMGDRRGDEFLFSVKGRARTAIQGAKNAGTHGAGRGAGRGIQRDGDGGRPAASGPQRGGELPGDPVQGVAGREGDDGDRAAGGADHGREVRSTAARQAESEHAVAAGGVI